MRNDSRKRCAVAGCGRWATHVHTYHVDERNRTDTNRVFLCDEHNEVFKKEGMDFYKTHHCLINSYNRVLPLDGSDAIAKGEIVG